MPMLKSDYRDFYTKEQGELASRYLPPFPDAERDARWDDDALRKYLKSGFDAEEAQACLLGQLPAPPEQKPETLWELHALGTPEEERCAAAAESVAVGLLTLPGSVSLQIVKQAHEIPRYCVGTTREGAAAVPGILRGTYGQADGGERKHPAESLPYQARALITRRYELEEKRGRGGLEAKTNWPMAVLLSTATGAYRVQVDLVPVPSAMLRNYFDKLESIYNVCAYANSLSAQISGSRGNSRNVSEDLPSKLKESLYTVERLSTNDGLSQSRSFSGKALVPELCLADLKHLAEKNQEAMESGGWTANISIHADSDATLLMLEAALTGAFAQSPFVIQWDDESGPGKCGALWIARSDAGSFLQLPDGNFPGFQRLRNRKLSLTPPYNKPEDPITLGKFLWYNQKTDFPFVLPRQVYNRHAFVCGMTGAGKTTTMFHILPSLRLPFLVIEPVKSEYRRLAGVLPDMRIYNMNPASGGVLRINPFWFPKGGSLAYHLGCLKSIISSAFVLYSAMPNILEQCLTRVYVRCGWNIASGRNTWEGILPERYLYPNFTMLCKEIDQFLKESKYTGETLSTYQGALLTRLQVFTSGAKGVLFDTDQHPDYDRWQRQSVIVELEELSSDADKCIALGVLTLQYFECVRLAHKRDPREELRHLIVIEEAHRLFKRTEGVSGDPEAASPEQQMVETLSNMMAEIRAYGEGFFIVDQSPAKVAEDVIRNSSVKLIHRLDNLRDVELIESSLKMEDASELISTLKPGQALVATENMAQAALVYIDDEKTGKTQMSAAEMNPTEQPNTLLINYVQADAVLENQQAAAAMTQLSDWFISSVLYDVLTAQRLNALVQDLLRQIQEVVVTFGSGARDYLWSDDFLTRLVFRSLDRQFTRRFPENPLLAGKCGLFFSRCIDLVMEGGLNESDVTVLDLYRNTQIRDEMRQIFRISRIPEYQRLRRVLPDRQPQAHWEFLAACVANTKCRPLYAGKSTAERQKTLARTLDNVVLQPLEPAVRAMILQEALLAAERLYGEAPSEEKK